MGDRENSCPKSLVFPPGSRFHPSEEQLLSYYLISRNNGSNYYGIDVIQDVDLYSFDPFNLPEYSCFQFGKGGRRRHWYFYVARVLRERGRRMAGCGYWKRRGTVRDVVGEGSGEVVVGRRKCFQFYLGDSAKDAVRTHWVMYEYSLVDHPMASFVVCRVFYRTRHVNNLAEHVLSSRGKENVATMHYVDVQNNVPVSSMNAKSKIRDNNSHLKDNEVSKSTRSPDRKFDDQITHEPVLEQELIAIVEEDFIELDDLLCPLSGKD